MSDYFGTNINIYKFYTPIIVYQNIKILYYLFCVIMQI